MRSKYTEAKSLGFYIILGIDIILTALLAALVGTHILCISDANALVGALIGADGAMIGFMITIFAFYFTYNMPESVKERLKLHGFYTQIPRDMIRSVIILAISIVCAIVSYFVQDILCSIIIILSITQFLGGLSVALYVTLRCFKILRAQ